VAKAAADMPTSLTCHYLGIPVQFMSTTIAPRPRRIAAGCESIVTNTAKGSARWMRCHQGAVNVFIHLQYLGLPGHPSQLPPLQHLQQLPLS
jgi:hypothetical protein